MPRRTPPPTPPPPRTLPPPLLAFARLFNQEAFWESHEVLEAPWRETRSGFYKGLILLASAYVHVQRGNAHGVRAQLAKAERELAPYSPRYLGLDVAALLDTAARARDAVAAQPDAPDLHPLAPFPRLAPSASLLRGDEPELTGR